MKPRKNKNKTAHLFNLTVKDYLSKLGARIPTPGGGSAAAAVGSIGAALIEMAANYSGGRFKKTAEIKKAKGRLAKLIDLDARAYEKYRRNKTEKNLKKSAETAMKICAECAQILKMVGREKNFNKNLAADLKSGKLFLKAAFNAAFLNVLANLKSLSDGNFAAAEAKKAERMKKEIKKDGKNH